MNKKILHLEDHAVFRETTELRIMLMGGLEYFPAINIPEAEILLRQHRFDLIICDANVSGTLDGAYFAIHLKSMGENVLILSGDMRAEDLAVKVGIEFLERMEAIQRFEDVITRLLGSK